MIYFILLSIPIVYIWAYSFLYKRWSKKEKYLLFNSVMMTLFVLSIIFIVLISTLGDDGVLAAGLLLLFLWLMVLVLIVSHLLFMVAMLCQVRKQRVQKGIYSFDTLLLQILVASSVMMGIVWLFYRGNIIPYNILLAPPYIISLELLLSAGYAFLERFLGKWISPWVFWLLSAIIWLLSLLLMVYLYHPMMNGYY